MLATRYIISLLMLLSPLVAMAWEGVIDHKDIEPPRGKIYPYNSDTLIHQNYPYSSLYVSQVERWQQSAKCDTLFESRYIFPFEWLSREVILRVGYVDAPYSLEINGQKVADVSSGSGRVEFNITRQSEEGVNFVALRLSPNSKSRKIEGWRESSALSRNPIQDVELIAPAKISTRDIFATTVSSAGVMNSLLGVAIKTYLLNKKISTLRYKLRNSDGELVANGVESIQLKYRNEDTIYLSTRLPHTSAWSAHSPSMHTLDIEMIHDFRVCERHRLRIGLRELSVESDGEVKINGDEVKLRAKEVSGDISRSEIIDLRNDGVNTLILMAGYEPHEALEICDELGVYAVVTAPINSSISGDNIKVGGNITNAPEWQEEYISRMERGYYNARRHASVIAYNIASRSMNGYNLYEGYLYLKSLRLNLPIVNLDGGGEWNGDELRMKLIK